MIIERNEWIPVRVSYEIDAETREDAIRKLSSFDNGELSGEEAMKILDTRILLKVNTDAEAVSDIDEDAYWAVDGKTGYDLDEDEQ